MNFADYVLADSAIAELHDITQRAALTLPCFCLVRTSKFVRTYLCRFVVPCPSHTGFPCVPGGGSSTVS
jgi:hypothetical protein